MTDEEWLDTPPAQAMVTFMFFMMSIMMVTIGSFVGGMVTKFLNWAMNKSLEEKLSQMPPEVQAKAAQIRSLFDSNRDDALRNGLIIIASWSAFEAHFEDFCKGVLEMNPNILDGKDIRKLKVSLSQALASDAERLDMIYESIEDHIGKVAGVSRCEEILKFMDLSGNVPKAIKDEFYNSQVVRHVWAHRAGVADAKFVSQAAHLGFNQGELVAVTTQQLSNYLTAVLMYAMIIVNRHRALYDLEPFSVDDKADYNNSALVEGYRDLYPSMQSADRGTAAPESNAPHQQDNPGPNP
jgi:hypothetical protein